MTADVMEPGYYHDPENEDMLREWDGTQFVGEPISVAEMEARYAAQADEVPVAPQAAPRAFSPAPASRTPRQPSNYVGGTKTLESTGDFQAIGVEPLPALEDEPQPAPIAVKTPQQQQASAPAAPSQAPQQAATPKYSGTRPSRSDEMSQVFQPQDDGEYGMPPASGPGANPMGEFNGLAQRPGAPVDPNRINNAPPMPPRSTGLTADDIKVIRKTSMGAAYTGSVAGTLTVVALGLVAGYLLGWDPVGIGAAVDAVTGVF